MSLQQLQGPTTQNGPMFLHNGMFQPGPGMSLGQPLGTGNLAGLGPLQPGGGIGSIGGQLPFLPDLGSRPPFITPLPDPHNPRYMFGDLKTRIEGLGDKFGSFSETLGGFGEQLTGYQDALGSFNEQVGGMGKQFETISNRLDSVDKGLGSLGNQIASLENMQKAQPQEVMQPQQPAFNPMYSPFGFGLGALFGRRY
jgi:archaellum component FlaC